MQSNANKVAIERHFQTIRYPFRFMRPVHAFCEYVYCHVTLSFSILIMLNFTLRLEKCIS